MNECLNYITWMNLTNVVGRKNNCFMIRPSMIPILES